MKKGIRTFFVIVLCLAILFSLSANAMALDMMQKQGFTVTWFTVEDGVSIGSYHPDPAHLVIGHNANGDAGCIVTNTLFFNPNTKLTIEKGAVLQSDTIFMREEGRETSALHIYGTYLSPCLTAWKVRTLKVYDGCYLDITFDGQDSKNEFMGALNRDNPGFEYTLDGLHLTAGECTHNWSDHSGFCYACKMPCPGHSWVNDEKTNRGYCEHCGCECTHDWSLGNNVCSICDLHCSHDWSDCSGVCKVCGLPCPEHVWTKDENKNKGYCIHCGFECTHDWSLGNGVCANCGLNCEHVWPADQYGGNCVNCGLSAIDNCEHDYDSDYQCKLCHYINKDMARAEKDKLEKRIGELDAILAIDTSSKGMTGTFVSSGNIAILAGIVGIAIGVIITALVLKKKSTKPE